MRSEKFIKMLFHISLDQSKQTYIVCFFILLVYSCRDKLGWHESQYLNFHCHKMTQGICTKQVFMGSLSQRKTQSKSKGILATNHKTRNPHPTRKWILMVLMYYEHG